MTDELRPDVREARVEAKALAREEAERAARLALPEEDKDSTYKETFGRVYKSSLAAKGLCPMCEGTGLHIGQACTDCDGRGYLGLPVAGRIL